MMAQGTCVLMAASLALCAPALAVQAGAVSRPPPWEGTGAPQPGRCETVLPALRELLQIDPSDHTVHGRLGFCYLVLGRIEEASVHFTRALEIDPDDALSLVNLGYIRFGLGRTEEAAALLQRATALEPDAAPAHAALGESLLNLKRYGEAADSYERAIFLEPSNVGARANLALCYYLSGRLDEFVREYLELKRMDEASAEMLMRRIGSASESPTVP